MKLDTSGYYPRSPLGDEPEEAPQREESTVPAGTRPAAEPATAEKPERQEKQEPERRENTPRRPGKDDAPTAGERFATVISTAISWLMVPLMMPVYGILLIFGLSILTYIPTTPKVMFTLIVAAINVVIPSLLVVTLRRMGVVQDLGLNGRRERLIPYIITAVCLAGTAWLLWQKHFPLWVSMFYAGGALGAVVELIVNLRWKISAHAAGIAGVVALLIRMQHEAYVDPRLFTWLIVSIACAGLVGSARLWLRRHTLAQVLAGYAVGFCSVYFLTLIQ